MPQFNQYPAPVEPLTGGEQMMLAQAQGKNVVTTTDTVANVRGNCTSALGFGGGPSWTFGTGAPNADLPAGSLYSRTDGSTGSRLYVSAGSGTWNAVAGV